MALIALTAAPALHAHKLSAKRTLLFEAVGANELHVLVQFEVPVGKPATALTLSFDVDRDGLLEGEEERRLQLHLTERALAGLTLRIRDQRANLSDARSELRRGPRGGFELMIYAKVEIETESVSVAVENDATAEPSRVILLNGPRPIHQGFGIAQPGGGFRGQLGPAGRIDFVLGRL